MNDLDVSNYTDVELYQLLDVTNPSDRELEIKIHMMMNRYN